MNILVIGAAGFIGSHCVRHFIQKGHTVVAADVIPINGIDNFQLLSSANTSFSEIFQLQDFDFCINASGAASVPLSVQYPQRDFELNTYNVVKMLEAIRMHNARCTFINFSSAAVYGNPVKLPIQENDRLQPLSPYGYNKLMAEQVCNEYKDAFGINSHVMRIFSAYGPGLTKQFFWDFFQKAKNKNAIELWGTGKESRDFIFIDDIMKVIEILMQNSRQLPFAINVASGTETTMGEAANTFLHLAGLDIPILFGGQQREGDPLNWKADISVLQQFGYQPKFTIKYGLEKYIEWLRKENA